MKAFVLIHSAGLPMGACINPMTCSESFKMRTQTSNSAKNRSAASYKRTNSRKRAEKMLSQEWLKDFLSEMLAVEKGGVKLYQKALDELQHSEFEEKLTMFLEQTERHVELCTDMLTAVDADSDYRSPGARAADHKANGLISTKVPAQLAELNNLENLVLAETKDHWNWEMLTSVLAKITDPELKRLVKKATTEVLKQEQSHVKWTQQTLTKIAMEAAMQGSDSEADETDESDSDMTQSDVDE
jgi:rubrerythrin